VSLHSLGAAGKCWIVQLSPIIANELHAAGPCHNGGNKTTAGFHFFSCFVVSCVVVSPARYPRLVGVTIDGLTDSKKLTRKQRMLLDIEIRQKALAIGLGWVSAKQIDEIGLAQALKLASRRAIAYIRHEYKEIIIDGTIALLDDSRVTLMKKADLLVPSVSAASIVAKVARDNYMRQLDGVFPGYAFTRHVGYGTVVHRQAIERQGVTPLHRLSFAPLHVYRHEPPSDPIHPTDGFADIASQLNKHTTKQIGDTAENEAGRYLMKRGHEILARNWRTKFCEIDIVSRAEDTIYFTEVKYRKNNNQGDGLSAVTAKKQRQMAFAAQLYVAKNNMYAGMNLRLAVASVTDQPPQVEGFLELR